MTWVCNGIKVMLPDTFSPKKINIWQFISRLFHDSISKSTIFGQKVVHKFTKLSKLNYFLLTSVKIWLLGDNLGTHCQIQAFQGFSSNSLKDHKSWNLTLIG